MIDEDAVPDWPVVAIRMSPDGRAEVDGQVVVSGPGEQPREAAMSRAFQIAEGLGRPVRVEAREADGTVYPLIVDASGELVEAGPPVPPAPERRGLLRRRRITPEAAFAGAVPEAPPAEVVGPALRGELAGTQTHRAVPHASATMADPAIPRPRSHQELTLDQVRHLAESGDHPAALRALAELRPEADGRESVALDEIRAYLALLDGDAARAARLYTGTALDWFRLRADTDSWVLGLTECAHYSWVRVDDADEAYDLGNELLAAYEMLGISDSPRAEAARVRLTEIRERLI